MPNLIEVIAQQHLFFVGEHDGVEGRVGISEDFEDVVQVGNDDGEDQGLGET